jgi:hypothetical protein
MSIPVRLVRAIARVSAIALGRAAVKCGLLSLVRMPVVLALGLVAPICLGDPSASSEVHFEVLRSGRIPGAYSQESLLKLARDQIEFQRIWEEVTAGTALASSDPPNVDFGQSMVVAFFGAQGSNCDPYRLLRITARSDKLALEITHRVGGKDCTCADSVAEPYILVRIDRTRRPIDYLIQSETHDCA